MSKQTGLRIDRLQALVDERNVSLGQIEVRTGVAKSQMSNVLNGKRPNVYSDTLAALGIYFGVSLDYLMGLSDIKAPADRAALPKDAQALLDAMRVLEPAQRMQLVILALLMAGDLAGATNMMIYQTMQEQADEAANEVGADIADQFYSVALEAAATGNFTEFFGLLTVLQRRQK